METKHLLVGAIDIGTTHSGWAFSFVNDFERDPTKVRIKNWVSGSNLISNKTPTCLLIKPDRKTLDTFGSDAETKYSELTEDGEQNNYYYFKRFKTKLDKKLEEKSTLDWSTTLEDEMGRSLPALDVYSMCIKYLADDMVYELNRRFTGICSDRDIYWVLTVPAAWPEGAKHFMREAALKAGCGRNKLTIALESEAVSTYCKHLSDEQTVYKTNGSLSQLKAGTKYMILDAGGVTVDVSVHEVGEAGIVKQVSVVNGVCIGGIIVDNAFKDMLIEVFGKTVYDQLQNENAGDFLDLSRDFEAKKRNPYSRATIKLPTFLADEFRSFTGKSISDAFASSSFRDLTEVYIDKVKFHDLQSFFDASVTSIIRFVKRILHQEKVEAILMVGGYSNSPVLQKAVRTSLPDIKLVVPDDASSAVLKGAVIIGHSPKSIRERVPRYVLTTMSHKDEENISISKPGKTTIRKKFSRSQVGGSDYVHDISCTSCSEDDKNAEAEYHCTNCRTYFCAMCVSYHNRVFKTHTLLDKNALGFDQGQQSPSASESSTLKEVCKIHAGEVVKMYCKPHDALCCTVCVVVDHRLCNGVHYIPEIARRLLKLNEERSTVASLRQVKTNLEGLKLKREGDFSQAEKRLDGIVTEVKNMKTRIVQRTETLEKASIYKAQQLHKSIADSISSDIKSLENMLEGIDKELSSMEKRKSDDEAQLFVQIKQAEQECSKGNECMKSIQARNDKQLNFQIDKEIESTLATKFDFWM